MTRNLHDGYTGAGRWTYTARSTSSTNIWASAGPVGLIAMPATI
ncbi:MAG: hypothetical protein ACR2PG_08230 [Hyphomicrobiaceae bacterium]